jgi:hypothetical protein
MRPTRLLLLLSALTFAACLGGGSGPSDGNSPTIVFDAPVDQATVSGQVSIDLTVVDDFALDKVTILIDGVVLSTMFTAPFHANWNTQPLVSPSTHTIRVEALDVSKNLAIKQITVQVVNGHQAPPGTPQ